MKKNILRLFILPVVGLAMFAGLLAMEEEGGGKKPPRRPPVWTDIPTGLPQRGRRLQRPPAPLTVVESPLPSTVPVSDVSGESHELEVPPSSVSVGPAEESPSPSPIAQRSFTMLSSDIPVSGVPVSGVSGESHELDIPLSGVSVGPAEESPSPSPIAQRSFTMLSSDIPVSGVSGEGERGPSEGEVSPTVSPSGSHVESPAQKPTKAEAYAKSWLARTRYHKAQKAQKRAATTIQRGYRRHRWEKALLEMATKAGWDLRYDIARDAHWIEDHKQQREHLTRETFAGWRKVIERIKGEKEEAALRSQHETGETRERLERVFAEQKYTFGQKFSRLTADHLRLALTPKSVDEHTKLTLLKEAIVQLHDKLETISRTLSSLKSHGAESPSPTEESPLEESK